MGNLKFYKTTSAPDTSTGSVWFDTQQKAIKVKNSEGWEAYSITALPTTLPASDVYAWAKAATKPTYTYSEVGAAPASHTHTIANITGLQGALDAKIASSEKGAASGVAQLNENGKVPVSQLPSYVSDVLEYAGVANFPSTGEVGKIYVDTKTNLTYRWGGSTYAEISPSIALGETTDTAYAGDKGATTTAKVNTHVADTTVHITADERTKWNTKANTNYAGAATDGGAATLATSVVDYGDTTSSIQIGFKGTGLTSATAGYLAAFSSTNEGVRLRDLSFEEAKKSLDISDIATIRANASAGSTAIQQAQVVSGLYAPMMSSDRKLFMAEDCDALYSAYKRFTVKLTNNGNVMDNNRSALFDGTIESVISLPSGTNVISIDCGDNFAWTYGEGKLLVNVYDVYAPSSVSAKIYSNNAAKWFDVTMTKMGTPNSQWFEGATPVVVNVSKIEVTIEVAENADCRINSLLYVLARPDYHSSAVRKYQPETLYHNLTVPSLTIGGTSFTGNAAELKDFTSRVYDATLSRTANTILAAPDGSDGPATFRKLVENDLPNITDLGYPYNCFSKLAKDYDFSNSSLTASDSLTQVLKNLCSDYPTYSGAIFSGKFVGTTQGIYTVCIASTTQLQNGLPSASYGYCNIYGGNIYIFGTNSYSFYCQELVTTNYVSNHMTWAEWS